MQNPVLFQHRAVHEVPHALAPVLLIEVDPELRSSRQLLLSSLHRPVLAVCAYAEVVELPPGSNCRLAAIGVAPREQEAIRIARHIRRMWPGVKILLLGQPSERFDDLLYDASVMPSGNPAGLIQAARQLLEPDEVAP